METISDINEGALLGRAGTASGESTGAAAVGEGSENRKRQREDDDNGEAREKLAEQMDMPDKKARSDVEDRTEEEHPERNSAVEPQQATD